VKTYFDGAKFVVVARVIKVIRKPAAIWKNSGIPRNVAIKAAVLVLGRLVVQICEAGVPARKGARLCNMRV
jgi:hypothetical protein